MMHRLHEVSRRRSGECGIDVIVASASCLAQQRDGARMVHKREQIMTAEAAAEGVVELARKMDPEGPLALNSLRGGATHS